MVGRIYHVGLTVSDLERSIAFYRDVLGLEFQGEIFMEGEETDKMFRRVNCKARVAYLNGSKAVEAPPVELIQFVNNEVKKVPSDLFTTSISEVCFYTNDIDSAYKHLVDNNVECLSEPQYFDFRADGFGESRAFGSYSGNVAYCTEPGISLKVGQTMNKYDENYFNNLASNGVISGDEIRLFVGRILQYGYRGTISTSWRSQNEAAANSIAQA